MISIAGDLGGIRYHALEIYGHHTLPLASIILPHARVTATVNLASDHLTD